MPGRLTTYFRSVGGHLLVPLAITMTLVLAAHAVLSLRSAHDHFLQFMHADVERHSDLFMKATHDGMLLNRLDDVQAMIERLSQGPEVAAIRVCDKHGTIVLSANRDEIGQRIDQDSETCRSCHRDERAKAAAVLERSGLMRLPEGGQIVRQLTVIENEPACAEADCHYHPASMSVLGVLDVELSMAPFTAAVGEARRQLLWTTLVLILITSAVAALVVRRVVQLPVRRIREGAQRIAGGDLDTLIEVKGGHELAQLSDAFNGMVAKLRGARREVLQWSQTLEEKVAQKTEELGRAQHQVLHMEKMASLGKLSASVAHELNNPLGGMLTYARLVKRELEHLPLDDESRRELQKYVGVIDVECLRCGEIVRNLLTFARRNKTERNPTDLNQILERSATLVRHHLQMCGVQLRTEPLDGCSEILADAGQLEQALVALLVNAVEAMGAIEDREKSLSVRLAGDAREVSIVVEDNGAGIPAEILPHIFEPFFTTKQTESGAGLGLAVVYGIVHRHGGSIDVDSEMGRGTTFRIHLPRDVEKSHGDEPVVGAHEVLVA